MSYHSSGLNPIVAGTKVSSAWMEYVEDTLDTYSGGTFVSPATYIIRKNGSVYEAFKDGVLTYGGSGNAGSKDGTKAAVIINAALAACANNEIVQIIGGGEIGAEEIVILEKISFTKLNQVLIFNSLRADFDGNVFEVTATSETVGANSITIKGNLLEVGSAYTVNLFYFLNTGRNHIDINKIYHNDNTGVCFYFDGASGWNYENEIHATFVRGFEKIISFPSGSAFGNIFWWSRFDSTDVYTAIDIASTSVINNQFNGGALQLDRAGDIGVSNVSRSNWFNGIFFADMVAGAYALSNTGTVILKQCIIPLSFVTGAGEVIYSECSNPEVYSSLYSSQMHPYAQKRTTLAANAVLISTYALPYKDTTFTVFATIKVSDISVSGGLLQVVYYDLDNAYSIVNMQYYKGGTTAVEYVVSVAGEGGHCYFIPLTFTAKAGTAITVQRAGSGTMSMDVDVFLVDCSIS
jgi:hypothetical protein